jgi:hypothetical protein
MMTWDFPNMAGLFGGGGGGRDYDDYDEDAAKKQSLGTVKIVNHYTYKAVGEARIWLCDDYMRHEDYEEPGMCGRFLMFEGVRFPIPSKSDWSEDWKLHIELHENVEETLRVVGACTYSGDVPGGAIEMNVDGDKNWRELLLWKTMAIPTNIVINMYNPDAVMVSG